MKSIIEQASSILKAIEKAWNQAEQPKEFSIKIFETEERNFFGMTTKPAKIGIFFGDKPIIHEKQPQKVRPEPKECRPSSTSNIITRSVNETNINNAQTKLTTKATEKVIDRSIKKPTVTKFARTTQTSQGSDTQTISKSSSSTAQNKEKKQTVISTQEKPNRISATWNETMIASVHHWIKQTLELMNIKSVEFNSQVTGKNLKLTFATPLVIDSMLEKNLFRSFSHLIMSSLRNHYKQEIKDLRIVLVRSE